jgi:hypothetical protein
LTAPLERAGEKAPRSRNRAASASTKVHHMNKSSKRPSHRIYAVARNGQKSFWQAIGAAWPHGDGEGFNLVLDYLPLNNAEIVIRKPKAEEAEPAPETETA